MPRYNHMFDVAFSLDSEHPEIELASRSQDIFKMQIDLASLGLFCEGRGPRSSFLGPRTPEKKPARGAAEPQSPEIAQ